MPKASKGKYQLTFRSGGRLISGTFTIRDGMVFARSEDGRTKTTQIGGSPPETIARHLLRELAEEAAAQRRSPSRRAKGGKR